MDNELKVIEEKQQPTPSKEQLPPCHPDYQFYTQVIVVFIVLITCLIALILDPTGPNVRYFEGAASFCLGLILPNPKPTTDKASAQPTPMT